MSKISRSFYVRRGKRMQDIVLALLALICLSPLIALVAILVRLKLGQPVIFCQDRPGLNGLVFQMYKFRTMTNARNEHGELLPDNIRLTRFGRFLRSTSLDELPELWNVLRGEMSIIGPRPLLVQYLPLYNEYQRRRHAVCPGISGLAQVSGRNALKWDEKFDFDVSYVDNISFWGDWRIIALTLKKVFVREGISSEASVTAEPFTGQDSAEKEASSESKTDAQRNRG